MRLAFCIAILFVVTAGVVPFLDFFRHPKYYSIRVGMTAREVHAIVRAGYDAYPARNDGWVHYYF